jgi:hypothetical protein
VAAQLSASTFTATGHVQIIVMPEPNGRKRPGADAPNQPVTPYGLHRHHSRPSATHLARDGNLRSHRVPTVYTACKLMQTVSDLGEPRLHHWVRQVVRR